MRTEAYPEEHPVQLNEEEKRLRASTASRAWPRLAEHEAALVKRKAEQKKELSALESEKAATIERAREASRAAHEGHEPRLVMVQQRFVPPNTVITVRLDTEETVDDRAATEDEIREDERARAEAAKAKPLTAEQKTAKLSKAIAALDGKPHVMKWIVGQLVKASPESTMEEVKAALSAALDDGRLVEGSDGKITRAAAPADDGIVPDEYVPATH